ncbi:MAG: ABC transporter ATP-binding protein [Firmicutes bacterium HGW-Firmicutes-14]|nr:MAG: ABC transporter ATP-binding protein [Firmicutes bacterium HGW-Firmicutes-14]
MIFVEDLALTYEQQNNNIYDNGVKALANVNLKARRGERVSIIGPSGCGKSSLLFILAGLIRPSSGNVLIDSCEPDSRRTDTALILQDYGLFPWKTVVENASLGLEIRGLGKREQSDIVIPILEKLGLSEFSTAYPAQLSGGQRQRVAIARSLAFKPSLLLMDEPLSSLDALTRETLQQFILEIWREHNLTLVLVTHSIEEAVFLGSTIAVMSERPGTIIETIVNPLAGTPGYRQRPEFHKVCSRLRSLLGVGN